MALFIDPEVEEKVDRLKLGFNRYGLDKYGVSKKHLVYFHSMLAVLKKNYFSVTSHGIQNVPGEGRVMIVGNHSGGLPVDAGMLLSSMLLDHDPPRHVHGMVEYFVQYWPVLSTWFSRVGQLTGLPEHAVRLLEDERALMVFPEGIRGIGKLHKDKYVLQRFGTGFMRLALQTRTPIVPMAFIGGEDALPVLYHAKLLAKLTGAPYWPVPPHIVPFPLPVTCQAWYGEPMIYEGNGTESDEVVGQFVDDVVHRLYLLIAEGLNARGEPLPQAVKDAVSRGRPSAGGAA